MNEVKCGVWDSTYWYHYFMSMEHANSWMFHICQPCKHLYIGGGKNILEGDESKFEPCNIVEIEYWLLLKIGIVIYSIHYKFQNYFHCDSICNSLSSLYPPILVLNQIHIHYTNHITKCTEKSENLLITITLYTEFR